MLAWERKGRDRSNPVRCVAAAATERRRDAGSEHGERSVLELARALEPSGIRCQFQTPGQLVVSRQVGPIWPDRGNSFWVTHVGGVWYLFTWVPYGYQVPATADIGDVCRACMSSTDRAMGKVPAAIVESFGLTLLSDEEAETVYGGMTEA